MKRLILPAALLAGLAACTQEQQNQIKRDILTFLQNSVREPKLQYEDMKVKLFACLRIKQRIEETLNTDGPAPLVSTLRLTMENVRAEVKRRISEWPDMTVRTYIIQDSTLRENCVVKVNCQLTKTGDRLIEIDPVTGEPVELMWVKGSGGDLGTLTESGLAVLRLDRLRARRA